MIVKDEEEVLNRCLDSTKDLFDEIIIVDTGSMDHTKEIAMKYTNLIYDFKWVNDFAKARNYAFSKASKDFIMWLDADDVISFDNYELIKKIKENLTLNIDMVMMKYDVAFDENKNAVLSYYRERIIQNHKGYSWNGLIHEVIEPKGNLMYSEASIYHMKIKENDTERNLNIFNEMIQNRYPFTTRDLFYYARELYYHKQYEKALLIYTEVILKEDCWIENKLESYLNMSYCYKMLNECNKAIDILLLSMKIDIRAEILCELGFLFMKLNEYDKAIDYFERALQLVPNMDSGAFVNRDCYGFIPCLELCVCFDALEDKKKAAYYNEKAALYKPNHDSVIHNREYFRNSLR